MNKVVFIVVLSTNTLFCNAKNKDTSFIYKKELYAEVGHSTSAFIENFKSIKLNEYGLSMLRLGYNYKRFGICIDEFRYAEYNLPYNGEVAPRGYMVGRNYKMFNLGIKYRIYSPKFKLLMEPSVMFSRRPEGTEDVYIDQNKLLLPIITYYSYSFGYNSYGLGFGLNFKKEIFKGVHSSLGVQYNYFSEKVDYPVERYSDKDYNEYIRNYKINKNVVTAYLTLGYTFQIRNK